MAKIYFTITGTNHYYGIEFLKGIMKDGTAVQLEKEPENKHDSEAIKVKMEGLGQVGYVANAPYTVLGESVSAGRLYDKIGRTAVGHVLYVVKKQGVVGVICCVDENSLIKNGEKIAE